MYLGAALRKFGFALVFVCAACAEQPPPISPNPIRSKSKDAVLLSISGNQLTVTPLVSAPRLEIRSAREDGSDKATLFTLTNIEPLKPLFVDVPRASYDRVFSAALVFADGHRLVSSLRVVATLRPRNDLRDDQVLRTERAAPNIALPPANNGGAHPRSFLGKPTTTPAVP